MQPSPSVGVVESHLLQLLDRAVDLHGSGQIQQAITIYRLVLAQEPQQPMALHFLGIALHQQGDTSTGIDYLRQSCTLQPDNPAWYNDLGNVLFSDEQFDEASQAYIDALELDPHNCQVWNNLGAARLQCDDSSAAIMAFEQAVQLDPEFAPALIHLGNIYEAQGDKLTSAGYQCRAFVLPPLEGKSKEMLGISFYFLGRLPEAAALYRQWLDEEPHNPIAAHMTAACSQTAVPQRASNSYIEHYFDRYAETFNATLTDKLGYRGPQLMRDGLLAIANPTSQYDILDLGCGTGLCAPKVADFARSLIGVDLSAKMLEQARAHGAYDQLIKQEICVYLSTKTAAFDIILAADTVIYFGDLRVVIAAVANALRPGGHLIFTIEAMEGDTQAAVQGFQLHASGRYRHAKAYVTATLAQAGLNVLHIADTVLREEIRRPVLGMLVTAQRAQ